jgi:hypothetical protein
MKNLMFTALIALTLWVARPSPKDIPGPDCQPCPFVR